MMERKSCLPCAPQGKSVSVVIPVLNEAQSLAQLLPDIAQTLSCSGLRWEIVIVDDGGTDNLRDVVAAFERDGGPTNVQLLELSRNFGKEAALTAGLDAARGDAVVCMDGDGQHPHALLLDMIALWQRGNDMVIGVQKRRSSERKWLVNAKTVFYKFFHGTDRFEIPAHAGDFRLMDRRVVLALLNLPERTRYMKGLYAWIGFKTAMLPFNAAPRTDGDSKFHFSELFELALAGITSFSMKPLRLVSRVGVGISTAALIYGGYIVLETVLVGNRLSGWATLAAGMMLLSGIQLVCLGVIAEYLGRVFEETKQRPLYIVASRVDHSELTSPSHSMEAFS
jgi:glycosyltransferase involved in cell wall biosynthesis